MLEVITHGLFQSTLTNALFNIHEERCDLNGFGVCTLLASIQRKTTDKKNIQAVFISVFLLQSAYLAPVLFIYLTLTSFRKNLLWKSRRLFLLCEC